MGSFRYHSGSTYQHRPYPFRPSMRQFLLVSHSAICWEGVASVCMATQPPVAVPPPRFFVPFVSSCLRGENRGAYPGPLPVGESPIGSGHREPQLRDAHYEDTKARSRGGWTRVAGECHCPRGDAGFPTDGTTRASYFGPTPYQVPSKVVRPTGLAGGRLPNAYAIMNDRINGMGPEQYPPILALVRNETPAYPRPTGTDYWKSTLKVES